MKIEIVNDGRFGYTILIDGETVMECLGEEEVKELTIGEIMEIAENA